MSDWSSFVEKLKAKCDIVDIIGGYTNVVKKGNSFWACCPFHNERQPSFAISKNGQFYKCFGCGVSGDVIKFVMEIESTDFMGAVEILAKKVGMEVPTNQGNNGDEELIKEKKNKLNEYKRIHLLTAKYYANKLYLEEGQIGLNYLVNIRKLSKKTLRHFGLGYAPSGRGILDYLTENKVELSDAEACGILSKKDNQYYDFFGGRAIFPIITAQKEVIGFGGRRLDNADFGKYTNTKKTLLFDKSRTLFNMNYIKQLKLQGKLDYIILVEGYMDVVALYNHGVENVAASMGTSLTDGQARMLKRFTENIYICYDGDSAGKEATLRGLDVLTKEGINVKVVSLPDKLDPDETLLKIGYAGFMACIDSALPLIDYKLRVIKKKYDLKDKNSVKAEENRRKYTTDAINVIKTHKDQVVQEALINTLSIETGFDKEFLREYLSNNKEVSYGDIVTPKIDEGLDAELSAEEYVLAALISGQNFVDYEYKLNSNNNTIKAIYEYICNVISRGERVNKAELYGVVGQDKSQETLIRILDKEIVGSKNDIEFYKDCIKKLKVRDINRRIEQLNIMGLACESDSEKLKLIQEINALTKELSIIK